MESSSLWHERLQVLINVDNDLWNQGESRHNVEGKHYFTAYSDSLSCSMFAPCKVDTLAEAQEKASSPKFVQVRVSPKMVFSRKANNSCDVKDGQVNWYEYKRKSKARPSNEPLSRTVGCLDTQAVVANTVQSRPQSLSPHSHNLSIPLI